MTYAYVRVSTAGQNIDRQMEEMYNLKISKKNIYIDKQSGKNFDRENYQKLRAIIKKGDLLVIKSIDRLGRNYSMILDEWHYITKVTEADIFVVDMPLLDTRSEGNNLVGKFISDIVLQILSFVAETERDNIKKRQAEGIKIAMKKGKSFGRPKYKLPDNFQKVAKKYLNKEITHQEALTKLQMPRCTFFRYVKMYKEN